MKTVFIERDKPTEAYYVVHMLGDINDGDYIQNDMNFLKSEEEDLFKALEIYNSIDFEFNWRGEPKLKDGLALLSIEDYYFITEVLDFPRDPHWGEYAHTLVNFDIEFYDTDGKIYDVLFNQEDL